MCLKLTNVSGDRYKAAGGRKPASLDWTPSLISEADVYTRFAVSSHVLYFP